jgi:hypothetical protein
MREGAGELKGPGEVLSGVWSRGQLVEESRPRGSWVADCPARQGQ